MKATTQIALAVAAILTSAINSLAVDGQAVAVQGTNLVLSWPSQGYEYYMIQYWPDLSLPATQLTNCVPANSTNRTTFIVPCCTMAALGGGSGTNSGNGSIDPSESMAMSSLRAPIELNPDFWVVQKDGNEFPLKLLPPGMDTNGMLIIDPPTSSEEEAVSANSLGGEATPAGISDGGCDCPSYGFFRVWHIPDWLSYITNYTFDGPIFIPVDFKDYLDRVDSVTLLVNGQPTPYAQFMSYFDGVQTNWGMGIFFDRLTNGASTLQLLSTVRTSETLGDDSTVLVLSNLTRNITIGNTVTFTNWDDLMWNTNYTLRAQSTVTNVDWEFDIYDYFGNFVNSQSGHSDDGTIEWTWDYKDYSGTPRTDPDADPDFYPYITITNLAGFSGAGVHPNAGGTSVTRPAPPMAQPFPKNGSWQFTYMDNFYTDGSTNYLDASTYFPGDISLMAGGPLEWGISAYIFGLKYGTNYTQAQRDGSWDELRRGLADPETRNFYYFGHGYAEGIGGDVNVTDGSNYITKSILFPKSNAKLTTQYVRDNVTYNKIDGAIRYRFVWLDGCNTASGSWPDAWGIPKQSEPDSYYSTNHIRKSAFVGWNTEVGGSKDWGNVKTFNDFRKDWMAEWAGTYIESLDNSFDDANTVSSWVNQSTLDAHLRIYGYTPLLFQEDNH